MRGDLLALQIRQPKREPVGIKKELADIVRIQRRLSNIFVKPMISQFYCSPKISINNFKIYTYVSMISW